MSELNLLRKSIDEIAEQVTALREILTYGSTGLDDAQETAYYADVPDEISAIKTVLHHVWSVQLEQREALKSINSNLAEILEVLKKDKR